MAKRALIPSAREKALCAKLRTIAMDELDLFDEEETAKLLGLFPRDVRAIKRKKEWDIELAFRVLFALDCVVAMSIIDNIETVVYKDTAYRS